MPWNRMLLRPRRSLLVPPTVGPVLTQRVAQWNLGDPLVAIEWSNVPTADEYHILIDSIFHASATDVEYEFQNLITTWGAPLDILDVSIQPMRNGTAWGPTSNFLDVRCLPGIDGYAVAQHTGGELKIVSAPSLFVPVNSEYGDLITPNFGFAIAMRDTVDWTTIDLSNFQSANSDSFGKQTSPWAATYNGIYSPNTGLVRISTVWTETADPFANLVYISYPGALVTIT